MAKKKLSNLIKALILITIAAILLFLLLTPLLRLSKTTSSIPPKKPLLPKKVPPPDSILVKFKTGVKSNTKTKILKKEGIGSAQKIEKLPIYKIRVEKNTLNQKTKRLNRNKNVEYAEPNGNLFAIANQKAIPNDPYFSNQYAFKNIQAQDGWDIENGNSNQVIIAIVDTGVDLNHPDLSSKIVAGHDFINNDTNANDDNGHGTHVAGIAAAITNNGIGISGTSWGAKIMPVKVLDSNGFGTYQSVSSGITFAANNGAKVVNLSLGGYQFSKTLQNATNYANSRGATVIAAAGNNGDKTILYPAGNSNVLGVAATNANDTRASFSNHNKTVDVCAPGVSILSTYYGMRYAYMSGTSMSTPFASGLAGLIFSQNSAYSASQTYSTITSYSNDLGGGGRDDYYGWGRINILASLKKSPKPIFNSFNIKSGSYLRGKKIIQANVTSSNGISWVKFLIDNNVIATDTTAPFEVIINTAKYSNKRHLFSVKARNPSEVETTLGRNAYIDNYKPRTFAKRSRGRIRGRRKIATAKLYWKVYDPATGNRGYVKLKIKKRIHSKTRAKKKSRYLRLYKKIKSKQHGTKNRRLRRRYKNQAKIYRRRYRRIKPTYYHLVKTANYRWTKINKVRYYKWRTRFRGIYKFYVLAKDRSGNSQKKVAKNFLIIK